jgi:hypothetical protein
MRMASKNPALQNRITTLALIFAPPAPTVGYCLKRLAKFFQ